MIFFLVIYIVIIGILSEEWYKNTPTFYFFKINSKLKYSYIQYAIFVSMSGLKISPLMPQYNRKSLYHSSIIFPFSSTLKVSHS